MAPVGMFLLASGLFLTVPVIWMTDSFFRLSSFLRDSSATTWVMPYLSRISRKVTFPCSRVLWSQPQRITSLSRWASLS